MGFKNLSGRNTLDGIASLVGIVVRCAVIGAVGYFVITLAKTAIAFNA